MSTTTLREKMNRVKELMDRQATEASREENTRTLTPGILDIDKTTLVDALFADTVPERYRDCRPKNVPEVDHVDIRHGGCGACFFGEPGIGKTYAATALAYRVIGSMVKPEYQAGIGTWRYPPDTFSWVETPYLFVRIRDTFRGNGGETEKSVVDSCINAKVLLLDDLGAEKQSLFTGSTLYTILSRRLNRRRYTIITTNQTLEQIDVWERRVASRMAEMMHVALPEHDWRLAAARRR